MRPCGRIYTTRCPRGYFLHRYIYIYTYMCRCIHSNIRVYLASTISQCETVSIEWVYGPQQNRHLQSIRLFFFLAHVFAHHGGHIDENIFPRFPISGEPKGLHVSRDLMTTSSYSVLSSFLARAHQPQATPEHPDPYSRARNSYLQGQKFLGQTAFSRRQGPKPILRAPTFESARPAAIPPWLRTPWRNPVQGREGEKKIRHLAQKLVTKRV